MFGLAGSIVPVVDVIAAGNSMLKLSVIADVSIPIAEYIATDSLCAKLTSLYNVVLVT